MENHPDASKGELDDAYHRGNDRINEVEKRGACPMSSTAPSLWRRPMSRPTPSLTLERWCG